MMGSYPPYPGTQPPVPGAFDPGGGIELPLPDNPIVGGASIGGKCCGAGAYCQGACVDTIFGSACLGACKASNGGNAGGGRGDLGMWCPPPYVYSAEVGRCVDPNSFVGGGGTTPPPPQGGNGCACASTTSCELPNGRKGKTNKTRYYRFGDCRRGPKAGVVEPNTVCVTPRRKNYGNPKAALAAARRLNGAARHYHKIIDAVDEIAKAKRRKPATRR